jgi:hypothetical protein
MKGLTDFETRRRLDSIMRILEGRATVPGEAVRLGVDAVQLGDWICAARSAIATVVCCSRELSAA